MYTSAALEVYVSTIMVTIAIQRTRDFHKVAIWMGLLYSRNNFCKCNERQTTAEAVEIVDEVGNTFLSAYQRITGG